MPKAYAPIDCEFHDVLEATAVRRRVAAIRYRARDGQTSLVHARILDLYATSGVEYMRLDDGAVIRLDRIVSIDDVEL
jgi:Rho-binding antiterminator